MSAVIRIQCDGHDGECSRGGVVPVPVTNPAGVTYADVLEAARTHAVTRWHWARIGDDDLCRDHRLLPVASRRQLTAVGVALSARCDDGDHVACHDPACGCSCHPKRAQ